MGVADKHIDETAGIGLKPIVFSGDLAINIAAGNVLRIVPGLRFVVEKVESFSRTIGAGQKDFDVKIGGVSITVGTPALAVARTLHALVAAQLRRGSQTDTLDVEVTTDGTGACVNAQIIVWIRFIDLPE